MYRQISSFVISYSHEQNTLLCLFITRVRKNIVFTQNTQMKIRMACRATIRRYQSFLRLCLFQCFCCF